MNKYPAWLNLLVLVIVLAGILFAMPNIYGSVPAVQVGGRQLPIADTLGLELVSREPGHSVVRFTFDPRFTNPFGQLQGGMYAVLLDTAMAVAADGIATASLQYAIFRPTTEGTLTIEGRVIRRGKTLLYAEAEARDSEGRLVAK